MASIAVLFCAAVSQCRFAVVPRGDEWRLLWRAASGQTGSHVISADLAETLILASTSWPDPRSSEPHETSDGTAWSVQGDDLYTARCAV